MGRFTETNKKVNTQVMCDAGNKGRARVKSDGGGGQALGEHVCVSVRVETEGGKVS